MRTSGTSAVTWSASAAASGSYKNVYGGDGRFSRVETTVYRPIDAQVTAYDYRRASRTSLQQHVRPT